MTNLAPLHFGRPVPLGIILQRYRPCHLVLFQPVDPIDLVIFQPRFGLIPTLLRPLVLFQPPIPCSYTVVLYAGPTILGPLLRDTSL